MGKRRHEQAKDGMLRGPVSFRVPERRETGTEIPALLGRGCWALPPLVLEQGQREEGSGLGFVINSPGILGKSLQLPRVSRSTSILRE